MGGGGYGGRWRFESEEGLRGGGGVSIRIITRSKVSCVKR